MNPPSKDIKDLLLALSYAGMTVDTESIFVDDDTVLVDEDNLGTLSNLTFGSTLFIGREPNKPDNCVTIFDTGAWPPSLGLTSKGYEYPTIQIRVRNLRYIDGWTIIEEIKNVLHGLAQQTMNGTLYSVVYCTSGPALLDYDEHNRVRFIINFNLQRR